MYRDRGVYVFPAKERMRFFAYDSENAVEYPLLTYAEQLVDFLEIDMTPFRKVERFEDKRSGETWQGFGLHGIFGVADSSAGGSGTMEER